MHRAQTPMTHSCWVSEAVTQWLCKQARACVTGTTLLLFGSDCSTCLHGLKVEQTPGSCWIARFNYTCWCIEILSDLGQQEKGIGNAKSSSGRFIDGSFGGGQGSTILPGTPSLQAGK